MVFNRGGEPVKNYFIMFLDIRQLFLAVREGRGFQMIVTFFISKVETHCSFFECHIQLYPTNEKIHLVSKCYLHRISPVLAALKFEQKFIEAAANCFDNEENYM